MLTRIVLAIPILPQQAPYIVGALAGNSLPPFAYNPLSTNNTASVPTTSTSSASIDPLTPEKDLAESHV